MKNLKTLSILLLLAFFIPVVKAKPKPGNNLGQIVSAYTAIKNAMANGDGTMAKINASNMFHILAAHPDKGLSHAQRKIMAKYLGNMVEACSSMSENTEMELLRPDFAKLTANMHGLLKDLKMRNKGL